jgi:hypothetical protein
MGNATQRREKREAARLRELAGQNPERFLMEWQSRIEGWVMEINGRARAAADENVPLGECLPIFDILAKAERLLGLCGESAPQQLGFLKLVRDDTRRALENECCKAVARLTDPRLYRLTNNESNYRLMKAGTHRPPR